MLFRVGSGDNFDKGFATLDSSVVHYKHLSLLFWVLTSWASREVVLMFAGRFAHQFFEFDPEIWYGHSLGYNKELSLQSPIIFFFRELRAFY